MLSVAVFLLHEQSRAVTRETAWPTKPKIVPVRPFKEKGGNLWSRAVILKLQLHPNHHPEGLLKHRLPGCTFRFSDSASLAWSLRTCISDKLPGGA